MLSKNEMIALAKKIAVAEKVDPALLCALCHHESGDWNPWAIRFEPGFLRTYVQPLGLTSETEKAARSTSWGLGQVMGQTARELGFKGTYLSEMIDPEVGITWAARYLWYCISRTKSIEAALMRYNGGSNKDYPVLVMRHLRIYQQ